MHAGKTLVGAAVAASLAGIARPALSATLGEVVVTATRRAESVHDVPYNISAISGDVLAERGIADLTELTRSIPGISGPDLGSRAGINSTIVMRGINVGDAGLSTVAGNRTVSPVSTYVNDTPVFTNFRLLDIERVEILRGPQGTLYGSGAVGGTLRFIARKPEIGVNRAESTADVGHNAESDELNFGAQFIANFGVSDTVAIRLAAAYERLGGVVDATSLVATDANGVPLRSSPADPDSGPVFEMREDVDEGTVVTFKGALLWQPADGTEVVLNYLRQDEDWEHGTTAYVGNDPGLGRGPSSWEDSPHALDPVERSVDIASFDVNREYGFATFTSSTSYTIDDATLGRDTSDFYETIAPYYFYFPRFLVQDRFEEERKILTQEFRLASSAAGSIDWVAGLYFSKSTFDQQNANRIPGFGAWADDPTTGASQFIAYYYGAYGLSTVGDFIEFGLGGLRPSSNNEVAYTQTFSDEFKEYAAYGELGFRPAELWRVTLGARFFRQELDARLRQTLPYCGPACSDDGASPLGLTEAVKSSTFNDSIFKLNASRDVGAEGMVYLTVSQGFRRGGANALPLVGPFADPAFPNEYEPDKVLNKEIGFKGRSADGRLSWSAALYHIDWDDIQIETFTLGGFKGVTNGRSAESRGAELEFNARVSEALSLNVGYAYVDAELSDPVTITTGLLQAGDPLPFVSKSQASASVDYRVPLEDDRQLLFHLDANYRSGFSAEPNSGLVPSNQTRFDGYTKVNAGVTLKSERWSVQLYAKNLTNEEGLGAAIVRNANITPAGEFGRRGWISRPRSLGLRFTYYFD